MTTTETTYLDMPLPRAALADDPYADAIRRGVAALKDVQEADGCWKSTPDMGPLALAITALTEWWLGALPRDEAHRYATSLKRAQLADGGFEIHVGAGIASLGATAVCRAALKACGVADGSASARSAEARVAALGGYARLADRLHSHGEPAALFCAMVGLIPPERLPPLSPDMAALPWSERMLDGRLHGGVPMVIYACAAIRERALERVSPSARLLPAFLRAPARALARARLSAYLGQFQNPDGSWNAAVYCTVFNLIALAGVGLTAHDPMMRKGLAFIESRKTRRDGGIFVSIFDGEIWETAFSVLALSACGVPASDPAMEKGVAYLERVQCTHPQPRLNQPKPGAPRVGGWAFQANNETMPDCDDTGLALAALGVAAPRGRGRPRASIERGLAWIRGMQNAGGGWGSYVHGLPDRAPGAPLFVGEKPSLSDLGGIIRAISHPPAEFGDAAIADVVGRVLWGLGACGLTVDDPAVAKAVAFLERDARPDGSWWGIWNPAYVAGTAFAILGLAQVGANMRSDVVARASRWLVAAQNADGGFGEQPGAFLDPRLAGDGASTPSLTGIALRALAELAAARVGGTAVREAGERAAAYLLQRQGADGGWSAEGYLFTIIPPTFYVWQHHRLYYPLFGLGRWREVTLRRGRSDRWRRPEGSSRTDDREQARRPARASSA